MITLHVAGIPRVKGNIRRSPSGRSYDAGGTPLKRWLKAIAWEAARVKPAEPWEGPIHLTTEFRLPAPKSLPKTRDSYPIARRCGDDDKLTRAVSDALAGIIYRDDSQIVSRVISKTYADCPGVTIIVKPFPYGGYRPRKKGD